MDKNAIKKYAVWARTELIARVTQKALQYGIEKEKIVDAAADSVHGKVLSAAEKKQRQALIAQIQAKGFEQVMEEVAYTWFNRFSALRFMEVNGYLPSHVRVFTDEENNFKPQILTEAIHLELDGLDMEKVYAYKEADKTEELFKYLLIVQCNALNDILPGMFQKIEDYTELLLPDNLLREGSVVEQLVTTIPEEDWMDAVQIIGWLYQYYNSDPKDIVFANLKKNIKITKENIPAATQLFTPDWIVRYMVENSLGRLWLEHHTNDELKKSWTYYLDEANQEDSVYEKLRVIRDERRNLSPEEIRCIDPCMGSGHILVYMFDVLMQIYESYGYTARESVTNILTHNLWGLDIDERAAQLSYFAVMMKARQYDRRFFSHITQPHIHAIRESNDLDKSSVDYFVGDNNALKKAMDSLIEDLQDAKEYGAMLKVRSVDFDALYSRINEIEQDINIFALPTLTEVYPLIQVAEVLAQKYDVVTTNPPYMGMAGMSSHLSEFVKKEYPNSKADLFAVFIEKSGYMTKPNGFYSLITMQSWMFLSSYESLRDTVLCNDTIYSLLHLGIKAFEEIGNDIVQTATFVLRKTTMPSYSGSYFRLLTHNREEKVSDFLSRRNMYTFKQALFADIPGSPVAYWVGPNTLNAFVNMEQLGNVSEPKQGIATADNNRFLRLWHEVAFDDIAFGIGDGASAVECGKTWFPYQKGGDFRKWYGNNNYVVLWKNNGQTIKSFKAAVVRNPEYHLREGLSWTWITTGYFGARFSPQGSVFDVAGSTLFANNHLFEILGYMCSSVADYLVKIINPTINFSNGVISKLPITLDLPERVDEIVRENVEISRTDWDSFETSWEFQKHPLVPSAQEKAEQMSSQFASSRMEKFGLLEWHFENWKQECENRFSQLKNNEEELNRIFIDVFGLHEEVCSDVAEKDVTVRTSDLERDIKSLISYAVGCMFGRYSLDIPGIVFAGGEWNDNQYKSFKADKDGIIPICDDEYFEDDIVGRFIKFIEVVYGQATLTENLKFIANALGGKGNPKEVIRSYFYNDFFKDHCAMYQVTGSGKRPIYWQFDSGKKNGFKCLIYMHRYQPDTIARIRTDYVHEQQARYRTAIADLEQRISNASAGERVKLSKKLKTLQEQATEIHGYEEKIHHLADQMIRIDLDDGVKKNYEIFKDVLAKIK